MIEKTKAVEILKSHGYQAKLQKGVVLVKWVNEDTYSEIAEILKEAGYNSSFGATSDFSIDN